MERNIGWKRIVYLMCAIQVGAGIAMIGVMAFLPLFLGEIGVTDAGEAAFWAGLISGVTPFMIALSAFLVYPGGPPRPETCHVHRPCSGDTDSVSLRRVHFAVAGIYLPPAAGTGGRFRSHRIVGHCFRISGRRNVPYARLLSGGHGVRHYVRPLVGGLVADTLGYRMPFVFFGVLSLLCLICLRLFMPEIHRKGASGEKSSTWQELKYFAAIPRVRLMVGIQFLCNFGITGIVSHTPSLHQGHARRRVGDYRHDCRHHYISCRRRGALCSLSTGAVTTAFLCRGF